MRGLILALWRWSGVMGLWRVRHRHEVTILMVHGVMDTEVPTAWAPLRDQLPRRRLDECLRVLSRYYRFVSLAEAVDMVTGRTPVRPYSLALTFDDGYRNQITHALPILRRHGMPATFFVVSGHIEYRKPFWFDRLDYSLQQGSVDGRCVQIGHTRIPLRAPDRATLRASYKRLRDAAKELARPDTEMLQEMEGLAADLEAETNRKLDEIFEDDDWSAILTWKEIRDTNGGDVSFGSHTVDHVRLGLVDEATMRDQLLRSKQTIETRSGRPCHYLCYPNGSVTHQVAAIARECGYEAGMTTEEGTNHVGDDPMTLRRIDLPVHGSLTETLARVSGLSEAQSRLIGRLRTALRQTTRVLREAPAVGRFLR